jgi:hypothetical protein
LSNTRLFDWSRKHDYHSALEPAYRNDHSKIGTPQKALFYNPNNLSFTRRNLFQTLRADLAENSSQGENESSWPENDLNVCHNFRKPGLWRHVTIQP